MVGFGAVLRLNLFLVSGDIPICANVFLVYFEKNWLEDCPSGFNPHYWRRYVDGIFIDIYEEKRKKKKKNVCKYV